MKDLVPLAAIGSAYVCRDGTSDRQAHALARIPHQIDYEHEHEQQQEWNVSHHRAPQLRRAPGLVQGAACVRLVWIHNGTGRGQRASAFAQGYGATRRRNPSTNDELMLMIDHRSQRFEVRSRTRAPFRIAQLDLAKVWRPGGKGYQTRVRNLQKPANF